MSCRQKIRNCRFDYNKEPEAGADEFGVAILLKSDIMISRCREGYGGRRRVWPLLVPISLLLELLVIVPTEPLSLSFSSRSQTNKVALD